MGRWQRFVSRFFPPEADLIAEVDATEDGDALAVSLAVPRDSAPDGAASVVTAIDLARGRVRTAEGRRRLSASSRRLVEALAPEAAGRRVTRTANGIVRVEERALPDTLRALRSLAAVPEAPRLTETPNARAIKLADRRPLQYEFQVDVAGDDALSITPRVVSPDGKVRLSPDALVPPPAVPPRRGQEAVPPEPPRWVRLGKTYYPAPAAVAPDVADFAHAPVVLSGDAVPFFLVRQLKQLARNGKVVTSDAARAVRVAPDALEPVSVLDLDSEGWLSVDVQYRGGGETFSAGDVAALPEDAQYIRRGTLWVPIDRKADVKLSSALATIERDLGARRDAEGRLRVAPGQGDDARRTLLSAVEIDEGAAFQKFLADLAGFKKIDPIKPPRGLTATLRPYQVEGYRWLAFLRKYYLNGVLADDMGLGKTISVLALLQYAKEHPDADEPSPSLVVCPTTVVDNWIDEAAKFTPELRLARYGGPDRERVLADPDGPPDVLVTTYETLRRDMGALQQRAWDYVILDEAQKIKNPITESARACRQLLARHRLAVTGTPIENRLEELWALFDFLMPGYLGSQARFRREFQGPIMRDKSEGAADELKRKIAPFVLRRMKEQVAQDLPPKIYVTRECQLTREQSEQYARVAGEGRERVLEAARSGRREVTLTMSILASLTHLKQICCHPALLDGDPLTAEMHERSGKFEAFKETLAERLEIGEKVLVFSQYAGMCKIIDRYLCEEGIPSLYLDGQTRNRQELVRAFQSDPSIRVFVLSLRAAGFGITLTAASSVIHYDRWWNPAVENQATDRAYRIGQKRSVQVVQFQTMDTIEEKIDKLLTSKSQLFGDVIETDLSGKSISREELLDLFTFSPLRESATEDGLPVVASAARVRT